MRGRRLSMGAFERGHCDAETFGARVVKDWELDLTPSPKAPNNIARYSAGTTKPAHRITAHMRAYYQRHIASAMRGARS
jgi:hypothetical protein